ncbi:MAG TPA: hypothetical protein VN641_20690 [Urbifossiella sp.]|nr:hypothetical protein [Urbifossiella sp.]
MRPRFPSKWAAAVAAGCLSRAPAAADTVNLTFERTTHSQAVSVNVKGTSVTGTPGPYYWQESNAPAGSPFPNPTTTFCVELTQHISTGNTYTYTETPLASTPGVNATEATLISELWGAHFNTAWESSSFTGSSASTAFQLALWELVYDSGSNLSLTSGNMKVTSADSTTVALAQSWLNGLSSLPSNEFATNFAGSQLVWLSNSYKQDQLTMLPLPPSPPPPPPGGSPPPPPPPPPPNGVPGPSGALLGLIGVGSFLTRSLRRRTVGAVKQ